MKKLLLSCCLAVPALSNSLQGTVEAPPVPRSPSAWASGIKVGFGTAYEAYDSSHEYSDRSPTAPLSKVWFTLAQGVLSEVYWPTLDSPQLRDSQFLVTDGHSFLFEERLQAISTVKWVKEGVPAFEIRNRDPQGRFEIIRTVFTDPDRNVILQKVKVRRHIAGLKFYVLHNPSVQATPLGNNAKYSTGGELGEGLFAWQDQHAQALVSSLPLLEASVGFSGHSDGWSQLNKNKKLTEHYQVAFNGDVVLTARYRMPESIGESDFSLALGLAPNVLEAAQIARASLAINSEKTMAKYIAQWESYLKQVRNLSSASHDKGQLFFASVAILKSMEDKTFAGAYVASPVVPWGLNAKDWNDHLNPGESRNKLMTGYHLVWPRDLYHMATCFMAIDDYPAAIASLNYLKSIQYDSSHGTWDFGHTRKREKDGSFPQNVWIDGTPAWGSLQLDEVSLPVVLAYRLWKAGKIQIAPYWDMIKRATDFVADFGPWSPQERWEEQQGLSPSTIATEIAALRSAAEMAGQMGDLIRHTRYSKVVEDWTTKAGDNIDTWLYTTTGQHGNGQYYVRIEAASRSDQVWDPNDNAIFNQQNNSGIVLEKNVTDGGFLELVRFGVKKANDLKILNSVVAYDATIRRDLPGYAAPTFYRYLGDRYNYDESTGTQSPHAMLWPIFTGERAHYELQKAIEEKRSRKELDSTVAPFVKAMEQMATASLMLPEQIWDATDPRMGQSTGSATPLGWTHAEYIKLLRSRSDLKVFDHPTSE